jgi:integrase
MPPIKLKKGPVLQRTKGKDYWYAWRGGPRIHSAPETQAFLQELADALAARHAPDTSKVSGLVAQYRASSDFADLAPKTRQLWSRWLDRVRDHFGPLSLRQFDRPAIKPEIRRWHHSRKATPRAADTGLQVLSRLLSFGMDEGKLGSNQCNKMPLLHESNRADVVWTDDDLKILLAHASPEVSQAARLAVLTGLRKGDLLKLAWSHVGQREIELKTGKSRGRRKVRIPITAELQALLDSIPKRATTVLTSSECRPWTEDGFGSSFWKTIQVSGLRERGLRFHDFRGTAATRFYLADFTLREIAEVMGWSEKRIEDLIDLYVKRDVILDDRIRRLEERDSAIARQSCPPVSALGK